MYYIDDGHIRITRDVDVDDDWVGNTRKHGMAMAFATSANM